MFVVVFLWCVRGGMRGERGDKNAVARRLKNVPSISTLFCQRWRRTTGILPGDSRRMTEYRGSGLKGRDWRLWIAAGGLTGWECE